MQGMIMHHSQAVEMTELLRTRSRNRNVLALGKRISISQTDEMKYMKQWLRRPWPADSMRAYGPHASHGRDGYGRNVRDADDAGHVDRQSRWQALERASGARFDHLFLTGMIQHHTGALVMVQELFNTAGAGQDNVLFDFATDVDNTQTSGNQHHEGHAEGEEMIAQRIGFVAAFGHFPSLCAGTSRETTVYSNPRAAADDPRVGLKGGLYDAGEAASGLEKIASLPKPPGFAPGNVIPMPANAMPPTARGGRGCRWAATGQSESVRLHQLGSGFQRRTICSLAITTASTPTTSIAR